MRDNRVIEAFFANDVNTPFKDFHKEKAVSATNRIIGVWVHRRHEYPNSLVGQIRYYHHDLWKDDENYNRYEAGGKEKANALKDGL